MNRNHFHLFLAVVACLSACSSSQETDIVTLTVEQAPFEIRVEAEGTLRAVKATPITAPESQRGPNVIGWIAEEGTVVKTGDVLVRFDDSNLRLEEVEAAVGIKRIGFQMAIDGRRHGQEADQLESEIDVLRQEREQAARFAPKDTTLFTRNEIIESEVNLEFLDSKTAYNTQKKDRQQKQATTEIEIHQLDRKSQEIQLQQAQSNLGNLTLKAPHDGIFYYERNRRGEPPAVGEMAWGGMKLGSLPDLDTLEARVYVLEKEAAGIKTGLSATLTLDAYPGIHYPAKIKQVASLAKPVERKSPVAYFEVILELEKTDVAHMRPGGLVHAQIFIEKLETAVALPNQALFFEDQTASVYVKEGSTFVKRVVEVGRRGPTRTQILKGLNPGELVALSDPTTEAKP